MALCRKHPSLVHDYVVCPACARDEAFDERNAAIEQRDELAKQLSALVAEEKLAANSDVGILLAAASLRAHNAAIDAALAVLKGWNWYGDRAFSDIAIEVGKLHK